MNSFSNTTVYKNSERLNVEHGGLNPDVTNVVFTHGSRNPVRGIGVQSDLNKNSPVFIIEGKRILK